MKKVLKIVAIISMLLLTVFAGGCGKSQEEKYTEARNEFVAMQEQFTKDFYKLANEPAMKNKEEENKKYFDLIDGFEKEANKKLKTMEELAKGKLELTKDVNKLKQELKEKNKEPFMIRDIIKDLKK